MIIFLIAGTIFVLIAVLIVYRRLYFLKNAQVVDGRVIAIEENRSSSRSKTRTNNNGGVTYGPIIEYYFKGDKVWFSSGGSSQLEHEIGQTVKLLSLPSSPEAVLLKKSHTTLFVLVFGGLGTGALATFFLTSSLTPHFKMISLALDIMVLIYLVKAFKGRVPERKIMENFVKSATIETEESLKGRTIFRTQYELDNKRKKWAKVGLVISIIFLAVSGSLSAFLWGAISQPIKDKVFATLANPSSYNELLLMVKIHDSKLIFVFVSFAFTLIGVFSFISSLKKSSH